MYRGIILACIFFNEHKDILHKQKYIYINTNTLVLVLQEVGVNDNEAR